MRRRETTATRRAASAVACAIALASAVDITFAATTTTNVTLTNSPVGVTPRYIGYNMGHYMPGSNTSAWLEYSGVNAYRFWAASSDYESTTGDDLAPYGDNVVTLDDFDNRKAALRATPE